MNFDTRTTAGFAAAKLDLLLERALRDTGEVLATNNIPDAVTHYVKLRDVVDDLASRMAELQKHLRDMRYELLITLFRNNHTTNIKVDDVGVAYIVDNWSASIIDGQREPAFEWLRATGNGSLITETVNGQTLKAFAKDEAEAQRPLPSDIFKVEPAPYIGIRQK